MVRKRKVGEGEEISCNGEMGIINEAAQQTRKRFVGVRQRPSGRWVAEIKDTIQHIRVWLGTFDSAEEAARAYDEAACLLRGANTRTNFWPSSYTPSALSSKITNLLLHRLRERNSSGGACVQNHPQFEGTTETQDTESFDHFFDDIPYITPRVNSTDTLTNYSSTSEYVSASSESNLTNNQGCDGVRDIDFGDNWTSSNDLLLVEDDLKIEEEEEEEEVNMGIMDLQFVDEVGLSLHYSPFEIAEEMAEPIEQGDDPCLLTEAMKRMKYERKFSASFYAFNGISECLRLKLQYSGSGNDMGNENTDESSNLSQGQEQKNELGSTSSSSTSSTSQERSEFSLWSSLD